MFNLYSKLTTAFAAFAIICSTSVLAQVNTCETTYLCDGTSAIGNASWGADCPDGSDELLSYCCVNAANYAAYGTDALGVAACDDYMTNVINTCGTTYLCDGTSTIGNAGWGADCADGSDEVLDYCCINADLYAAYGTNELGVAACNELFGIVTATCDDATACNFGEAGDCTFDCFITVECGTAAVGTYAYEANDASEWSVTGPEGSDLQVTFNGQVENNWDYLHINGGDAAGGVTYTGDLTGVVYISTGNTFTFSVSSDGGVNYEFGWSIDCATSCDDATACNFGEMGDCTFAAEGFDCDGACLSGTLVQYTGTGAYYDSEDSFSIVDCDGNVLASYDAGSYEDVVVVGCIDLGTNYVVQLFDSYGDGMNGSVTVGDVVYTLDTGSESSTTVGECGCADETACNFGAAEMCWYAAEGLDCDGNCLVGTLVEYTAGSYAYENSFTIVDCDGMVLASMASGTDGFSSCVELPTDYVVTLVDSWGDSWNGGSLSIGGVAYTVDATAATEFSATIGSCGCADETACNFGEAEICWYADEGFDCDGNCLAGTLVEYTAGAYAYENSFTISDCDGNVLASMASGADGFSSCVALTDVYSVDLVDSWGDGWNGGSLSIGGVAFTIASGSEYSESVGQCPCTDMGACNYEAVADCDYSCVGCMDNTAANYDPAATMAGECVYCDPGSLVLTVNMSDSYGDGWNGAAYYIYDADGNEVATGDLDNAVSGDGMANGLDLVCLYGGCYSIDVTSGSAPSEVSLSLVDQFGTEYGSISGGSSLEFNFLLAGDCGIVGCTNAGALNYNISASIDDGSCQVPPANDLVENAEAVLCGAMVTGTLEYSMDDQGLVGSEILGVNIATEGVWYQLNAAFSQQVMASTCSTPSNEEGTDYITDTKLHVYTMVEGALTPLASNDDGCESGFMSTVAFSTEVGSDYYIYVSRYSAFSLGNDFVLSVDCTDCGSIPSNDNCDNAIAQVSGITFTGSTCCANADDLPAGWNSAYGVWFTFNSGDFDTFDFNVTNVGNSEIGLAIYGGDGTCEGLDLVAYGSATGSVAGSIEDFTVLVPNTDYYFAVWNEDPATCGDFEFTTTGIYLGCMDTAATNYDATATMEDGSCEYVGVVPANDTCTDAISLDCNTSVVGSTGGASSIGAPSLDCDATPGPGVWYTFVGDGQLHSLSTCGSDVDTKMNVYSADIECGGGSVDVPAADACGEGLVTVSCSVGGGSYDYEITWSLVGADGVAVIADALAGDSTICVPAGDYTVQMNDSYGDGWNGAGASFSNGLGESMGYFELGTGLAYGEETLTVAAYSMEPVLQPGDFTCVASVASDFVGCGFYDQDDASYQFVSTPGLIYYVYVGSESYSGSFNLDFNCEVVVEGCMNDVACNYNADANVDAECDFLSCVCADETGVAVMINMNDSWGDGWNGAVYTISSAAGDVVATGSIDEAIFSVDENNYAGPESGFDTACLAPGCYSITVGGGSFDYEISWDITLADGTSVVSGAAGDPVSFSIGDAVCGCTDATACNYDLAATNDDGSCEWESCAGCTDDTSCSYDADATVDDGSCCYSNCVSMELVDSWGDGWNGGTFSISTVDGTEVASGTLDDGSYAIETYCLADGCYTIDVVGASFAGEMSWNIIGAFGGIISGLADESVIFNVGSGDQCVVGCAISCACNYDENVNIADNDLCVFEGCGGCTYPDASNYDMAAVSDNGTCLFEIANPCPADLNGDGSITTGDLLIFLGAFGTICE